MRIARLPQSLVGVPAHEAYEMLEVGFWSEDDYAEWVAVNGGVTEENAGRFIEEAQR